MLLKLIPAHSEPTIHFSLSFADLPPNLPTPTAWTSQLAQLMLEDLEVPATMHSLDRSAGVTSLLEEVALDIALGEIRCRFVDGKVERWGFWEGATIIGHKIDYGKRLARALESIVRNVKESTLEDERIATEREMEKQEKKKLERSKSVSSTTAPKTTVPPGKVTKHKKQRSFFMHIVSCVGSIVNLASPSTASYPSLPSSRSDLFSPPPIPAPSISKALPPPGTSARARALRRAARSALVDTYRQFILSELVHRFQGPTIDIANLDAQPQDGVQRPLQRHEYRRQEKTGFCVWILHSMRRRALQRMEQLLEEAEAEVKTRRHFSSLNAALGLVASGVEPATTAVPLSFSDDEDEGVDSEVLPGLAPAKSTDGDSDWDTETDGSSVHTPSSTSHFQYGSMTRTPSSSSSRSLASSSASSHEQKSDGSSVTRADAQSPPVPPKDLPHSPNISQRYLPGQSGSLAAPQIIEHLSVPSMHEYIQLQDLRTRLGHLLLFAASKARVTTDEVQSRLEILAVRSRRRAWSNRALSLMARSNVGGTTMYGLVTPFRSSSLARYMWTAEDLAREPSSSSLSSSSSSPSSSLSRCLSRTAFPSYRPRLRPKIQYDMEATLSTDLEANLFVDDDEVETAQEDQLVDREFEMYEEVNGPPPLGRRARRHVRGGTSRVDISSSRSPENGRSGIGRLFPVSEEIEGEVQDQYPDDDQVFSFAVRGKQHRERSRRTFMGCDEVGADCYEDEDSYTYDEDSELALGLGFGEFDYGEVPLDIDPRMEMGVAMDLPKIPRVRTTSMMGTFVHRTKAVQSAAFHAAGHQTRNELTKDSLLYKPVPASLVSSLPRQGSPPKLQIQRTRLKKATPSPAIYTEVEVDLKLDVQMQVGKYDPETDEYSHYELQPPQHCGKDTVSPPSSVKLVKQGGGAATPGRGPQEEFTLSMDLPKRGKRSHDGRRFDYPTRPLSRHQFEDNHRPNLDSIFLDPSSTKAAP